MTHAERERQSSYYVHGETGKPSLGLSHREAQLFQDVPDSLQPSRISNLEDTDLTFSLVPSLFEELCTRSVVDVVVVGDGMMDFVDSHVGVK